MTMSMTPRSAIETAFLAQRDGFARGAPNYEGRMNALATLRDAVHAGEDDLLRAVATDFGGRAREETLALELFPSYDQIRHARHHLKSWMRRRPVPSAWFCVQ